MSDHARRLLEMARNLPSMGSRTRAALLAGAEALERLEAMESTSSTMLPKSASGSEEQ
jgi:hypothetical protein